MEKELAQLVEKIHECEIEIGKAIIGQKDIIRQVLLAILSEGNVLLEGVPGLGKTQLVKTISNVLSLSFSRIQFTPDLMPADVTGTNLIVKEKDSNRFEFQKGPVFAHLVLADEINRATPKTQSSLLEAMQEKTVTVGKETYHLPSPFIVLATQNPIENEGTYPLPEAQLDRFLFKLKVTFPSLEELKEIMEVTVMKNTVQLDVKASAEDILLLRDLVKEVPMSEPVKDYALSLVVMTHPDHQMAPQVTKEYVLNGASPRAAQAIFNTARARALLEGRYNVSYEDINYVALPALRHRIMLNFEGVAAGITTDYVIDEIRKGLTAKVLAKV